MDKENTLYIDLKDGRVVIEMRPDLAPGHVTQIKKLAREGKYDGIVGVLAGFVVTMTLGSLPLLGPMFKSKGGQGDIQLHISQFAVLTSTVMLQAVGLIAGLLPAVKASRLDPIEALRYE